MLKILAVVGYIILAIILLLCWAIIVPRSVYVEYTQKEGITLKIRIFLFKLRLYPPYPPLFTKKVKCKNDARQAEEPPQELPDTASIEYTQTASLDGTSCKQSKKQPQSTAQDKTQNNPQSKAEKPSKAKKEKTDYFADLPQDFELVKQVLSAAKGVFRIMLRGIKFKDICFTFPLKDEDAYKTQKLYGAVTTAFYAFNTFLLRYMRIYYKNPVFIADFADIYENSTYFYCKIQASPSIMILVAWHLFKVYRKMIKSNTDKEK